MQVNLKLDPATVARIVDKHLASEVFKDGSNVRTTMVTGNHESDPNNPNMGGVPQFALQLTVEVTKQS